MKSLNKIIVIVMCAFALSTTLHAQNVVTLQHGNNATFYNTIDDAVSVAVTGDFIYIPGGVWEINDPIHVGVNIVGVGYNPDSCGATGTTKITAPNAFGNYIMISGGADNGSFTGVQFLNTVLLGGDNNYGDQAVNNFSFSRCRFSSTNYSIYTGWSTGNSTNAFFSENVFDRNFQGLDISGVTFVKNIFSQSGSWSVDQVQSSEFRNNIFMQLDQGDYLFHHFYNNTLDNNIILYDQTAIVYSGEGNIGNIFNNTIFQVGQYSIYGSVDFNSSWGQSQASIFVNFLDNDWGNQVDQDLHVQPSSPAYHGGNDGTDCGIYGTAVPFKASGVPFNPHIQLQSIGTSTDAQGHLPVLIHVAAQGN